MAIDMDARPRRPCARSPSAPGLGVTGLAWGIHDLVNENMANAARVHIAEHGKDPRRYALLATGGAGPVHAYYVAKKLGLRRLIAPRGRRRRLGAGPADRAGARRPRGDRRARDGPGRVARAGGDLRAAGGRRQGRAGRDAAAIAPPAADRAARRHPLRRPGLRAGRAAARRPLHGRLARRPDAGLRGELRRRLHAHAADHAGRDHQRARQRQHRRRGRRAADAGCAGRRPAGAIKGTRPVYFPEFRDFHATTVYDRYALAAGQAFDGPAIVEERESTLVVGPGGRFEVVAGGSIIVTIGDQTRMRHPRYRSPNCGDGLELVTQGREGKTSAQSMRDIQSSSSQAQLIDAPNSYGCKPTTNLSLRRFTRKS